VGARVVVRRRLAPDEAGGHLWTDVIGIVLAVFLLVEIVKFFRTGEVPVSPEETLEIYAFMEAADESKRQGGVPVSMQEVMEKARAGKTTVALE
jgi:hypothetical protein